MASPVKRVRWRDKIIFYPVHLTIFSVISKPNEEYERRFYSNSYDSYSGAGNWQQFEEIASARQSASGASNNTNASRAKLLVQLWAGIPELRYSEEATTYSVDKNLRRVKLSRDYLLRIFQSITFWFQHVGLIRPLPKSGTCEIFAIFFPRQQLEYFKQTKLALVRPGPVDKNCVL